MPKPKSKTAKESVVSSVGGGDDSNRKSKAKKNASNEDIEMCELKEETSPVTSAPNGGSGGGGGGTAGGGGGGDVGNVSFETSAKPNEMQQVHIAEELAEIKYEEPILTSTVVVRLLFTQIISGFFSKLLYLWRIY